LLSTFTKVAKLRPYSTQRSPVHNEGFKRLSEDVRQNLHLLRKMISKYKSFTLFSREKLFKEDLKENLSGKGA
jgi:hypothetical protein